MSMLWMYVSDKNETVQMIRVELKIATLSEKERLSERAIAGIQLITKLARQIVHPGSDSFHNDLCQTGISLSGTRSVVVMWEQMIMRTKRNK